MKIRKLMSVVLCLMLVMALFAGCGSQKTADTSAEKSTAKAAESTAAASTAAEPAKSEKIYIPVISKGFQHQFWQAVKAGAEKAAKELNVEITFEGPENESQVDKQIEMIEAALAKNPKALCLAALDSKACIPLLEKAKAANIPVIGFDSGVDSEIPVTTCSTDNVAASAAEADKMAELIGGKGEIACIIHDQTSRTGVDRRDGFVKRIAEKYPDIKIVDTQYSGDQLKATDLVKAMIQAHPNLKGIFASNEGAIGGTLNAVKELKKEGKLVVMGYDSGKMQKDAIVAGIEAGAMTQDPIGIGYKAVEAAVKAIKGEQLPKTIDTGFHWYDKTTIDSDQIKPLLYD